MLKLNKVHCYCYYYNYVFLLPNDGDFITLLNVKDVKIKILIQYNIVFKN